MRTLPIYKVTTKGSKKVAGGKVMVVNIFPVGSKPAGQSPLTLHDLRKHS